MYIAKCQGVETVSIYYNHRVNTTSFVTILRNGLKSNAFLLILINQIYPFSQMYIYIQIVI